MCKEQEEKVYSLTEQGDFGCGATELTKEDADMISLIAFIAMSDYFG